MTLDELYEQKKEIEKEIKRLKDEQETITSGNIRYERKVWGTGKIAYRLKVPTIRHNCGRAETIWRAFTEDATQKECLERINRMIDGLLEIKRKLEEQA